MKLPKMLRNLVLVKKVRVTKKNGIELPTNYVEEQKFVGGDVEVMAIGKDVKEIKVGDMVTPKEYVGNTIDCDDAYNFYLIIAEEDILAVR